MDKTQSPQILSRRDFLKLLAAAGVTGIGGHLLYTYVPWLNYDQRANQARKPFEMDTTVSAQMRELVRHATLAPNGHNAQPWRFAIKDGAVEIHPDYTRRLPVVDPDDRELWISLGCALENLIIAARFVGYETDIAYPESGRDFISVELRQVITGSSNPLFDAIPVRQSTRSEYDGQPVPSSELGQIESMGMESGVSMQIYTAAEKIEDIIEYIKEGDRQQYTDQAYIDELVSWLRFNKREALATLDGLYTRSTGNPTVPRWLGRMFVTTSIADQQAQTDETNVRSSSGLLAIVSQQDDRRAWVDTGRVYERLALTMTDLNIKSALLNQPIEVPGLRSEFQSFLGVGTAQPQLLLRFGYGDSMPRSVRRPVDQVLV